MSGSANRLGGARSGDSMRIPRVDEQDLRQAEKLGASFRMSSTGSHDARAYQAFVREADERVSQREEDRGTWFEHHNVPPMYRNLAVEGVELSNDSIERVLDAIDPEGSGREEGAFASELVARLAMPVRFEVGALGFKRANLELINAETVGGFNEALGKAVGDMQALVKAPRTHTYLARLRSALLDGDGGASGPVSGSDGGGERSANPFEDKFARTSQRTLRAIVGSGVHPSHLGSGVLTAASRAEAQSWAKTVQEAPVSTAHEVGASTAVGTRLPGSLPSTAVAANPAYAARILGTIHRI